MTSKDDLSNWDVPDGDEPDPFDLLYDRRADDGRADHGQAAAPAPSEPATPRLSAARRGGPVRCSDGGPWAGSGPSCWQQRGSAPFAYKSQGRPSGPWIRPLRGTEAAAKSSQALPSPLPSAGPPAVAIRLDTEATQALVPADPEPNAPVPLQSSHPASPRAPPAPSPPLPSRNRPARSESPLPAPRQAGGPEAPNREPAGAARKRAAAPAGPPARKRRSGPSRLSDPLPEGSPEAATDAQRLAATAEPTSES